MIKKINFVLIILNVFVVIFMIGLWGLLQSIMQKDQHSLDQIYLRKEDIMNQQQELEIMIANLNITLENEISRNDELSTELSQLTNNIVHEKEILAEQKLLAASIPKAPVTTVKKTVTSAS